MTHDASDLVAVNCKSTADIQKGDDQFYRCMDCGGVIPSVPSDNIGCACGNVFIDKDCWRLIVADLSRFEVVRRRK
jgi:hypothetical protein